MHIKWAAIIVGGMVLSSFLLLFLIQIVLAAGQPPTTPHEFAGEVTSGGVPAKDGLEIRVKAFDSVLDRLVRIELTPDSLDGTGRHVTESGAYGIILPYQVPPDNPETQDVREGARLGESLHFFVVTDVVEDLEVPARVLDVDRGVAADSLQFDPSRGTIEVNLSIIPPPELIFPIDGIEIDVQNPVFDWTASASEDPESLRYELQVVRSGGGVEDPFFEAIVAETELQVPLEDAEDYEWRVIARDSLGHEATSVIEGFRVQVVEPDQVSNVEPKTFTNNDKPTFEWNRPEDTPNGLQTYEIATADRGATPGGAGLIDFTFDPADFIDFQDPRFDVKCFDDPNPIPITNCDPRRQRRQDPTNVPKPSGGRGLLTRHKRGGRRWEKRGSNDHRVQHRLDSRSSADSETPGTR